MDDLELGLVHNVPFASGQSGKRILSDVILGGSQATCGNDYLIETKLIIQIIND